jgi:hypothetical protein
VAVVTCRCEIPAHPGMRAVVGAKDLEDLFVSNHHGRKYRFIGAGTVSVYCQKCNTESLVPVGKPAGDG